MIIKKEIQQRIIHEICENKILPAISNLGFSYLKSKNLFKIKGKEVDLELKIIVRGESIQLNKQNQFECKFGIHPILRPVKFNKWYEEKFKRNKNFSQPLESNNWYSWPVNKESLNAQDFIEPPKAKSFKSKLSSLFRGSDNKPQANGIEQLRNSLTQDILPLYNEKINPVDLSLQNSLSVQFDILYYTGKEDEARTGYKALIEELKVKVAKEEAPRAKGHLNEVLKENIRKYNLLFDEKLEKNTTPTSTKIDKDIKKEFSIGHSEYHLVGRMSNLHPIPMNILVHSETFRIIHQQRKVTHWDFELNKAERPKVEWKTQEIPEEALKLAPKNTDRSAMTVSERGNFVFIGGHNTKSYLIDIEKQSKQTLWAHETFKEGYKEKYKNVYNNFGVDLCKFLQDDKYVLACAKHAKNVVWNTATLERTELNLPFEFTFEGAPTGTEFANDVSQIEVFEKSNHFVLVIRNHALFFNEKFEMISILENVQLIRISESEEIIAVLTRDNEVELFKAN